MATEAAKEGKSRETTKQGACHGGAIDFALSPVPRRREHNLREINFDAYTRHGDLEIFIRFEAEGREAGALHATATIPVGV